LPSNSTGAPPAHRTAFNLSFMAWTGGAERCRWGGLEPWRGQQTWGNGGGSAEHYAAFAPAVAELARAVTLVCARCPGQLHSGSATARHRADSLNTRCTSLPGRHGFMLVRGRAHAPRTPHTTTTTPLPPTCNVARTAHFAGAVCWTSAPRARGRTHTARDFFSAYPLPSYLAAAAPTFC